MIELSPDWTEQYRAWRTSAQVHLLQKNWAEAFRSYPRPVFSDTPWTPLTRPLSQTRVALVTSGGLSMPGQPIFEEENPEGDVSIRVIPGPGPLSDWTIHHGHYDPADALEDYNCVFPLDALNALAHEGVIGSLTAHHISFMGYQPDAARLLDETAPQIAAVLDREGAEAVLLVPV